MSTASRGSAISIWRLSISNMISKPPGIFERADQLAGLHPARHGLPFRSAGCEPDPAEIAADRCGRGFGKLARIGDEAAALLQLLDDLGVLLSTAADVSGVAER